jgi:ankyrin repeat protein
MTTLSERSNLDHLRKQAKDLLRLYREGDPTACERLRSALPAARGKPDAALIAMQLRLHDMQSCIAREHGHASWVDLKDQVDLLRAQAQDLRSQRLHLARLIFGGDLAGGMGRARPALAARMLAANPALIGDDASLAVAVGRVDDVRRALEADAGWKDRAGGLLDIPPLIAAAHSSLVKLPPFRAGILECLRLLLAQGANPNAFYFNRWAPHSLEKPGDDKLTAIYGAAGKVHDVETTALLLAAGADANDNESLYHSIDDPDHRLPCMKLLLDAGTRVEGTNALAKVLDHDNLAGLQLLLAHTRYGDPDLGRVLHWAVYRGRSADHVRALLDKGANPNALNEHKLDVFHHAARFGLPEVMRLLELGGSATTLTDTETFVSACARADGAEARRLLEAQPDLIARLTEAQLKQLPALAMAGRDDAVKLMVELGWPIATRGGDIDGSALNWAVFRGRPELAKFLLEHGASFREPHGYNSDVLGTLSWASCNEPRGDGDWPRCAAALLEHGLEPGVLSTEPSDQPPFRVVKLDGRSFHFPEDVADVLLG